MRSRRSAAIELECRCDITRTLERAGRLTGTDVKATGEANALYDYVTAADRLRNAGRR